MSTYVFLVISLFRRPTPLNVRMQLVLACVVLLKLSGKKGGGYSACGGMGSSGCFFFLFPIF
jgi:hypothetical protein